MRKKTTNLVTGGAGFLGSHLIKKLLNNNEKVICIDNYISGNKKNIITYKNNPNFKFIKHDVTKPINLNPHKIWHLASPASPFIFYKKPIETTKTNFLGTINMLELARKTNAKILLASSSAIYGEAEMHPQKEEYKGYVNCFGYRSCYEEGKRIAETLFFDFNHIYKCDIRIARIFNTYGPNMLIGDGRVISNFIIQALLDKPITIFGDGLQTRSFCFVDDLINGLISLMKSSYNKPINLGNDEEIKIKDLANLIRLKIKSNSEIKNLPLPNNDPLKRKPSLILAKKELSWQANTSLDIGLNKTIEYFKKEL